jgi:hypothetical protein
MADRAWYELLGIAIGAAMIGTLMVMGGVTLLVVVLKLHEHEANQPNKEDTHGE